MAREIPEPVRAVAGLAATLLDEARKLPATLPALPVRALGLAMQTSLKLQQEYSGLVARGDEVLTGLRGESEPGLATFDDDTEPPRTDEPVVPSGAGSLGSRTSSFDRVTPVADSFDGPTDADAERAIDAVHDVAHEAASAPVSGYDGFTIAQLRGRVRGYQQVTLEELLAYEQASAARPAFLTLLRNRLEKITREQA